MSNRFFTIASPALRCTLCEQGASIASVQLRDRGGLFMDIALSPRNLVSGEADPSLAGRTIGPCCGRVRNGEIYIDEKKYQLTQNEGRNHLHGGANGCATTSWTAEEASPTHVRFRLRLPDGLDGYRGNRVLTAEYAVVGDTLRVVYGATTDAPTWLDLTNHVYWDLSGRFDGNAMDQVLEIAANRVVHNDESHVPTAIMPLDMAMDFTAPATLSGKLADFPDHPQLKIGRGFNNAYVLDPALTHSLGWAARLYAPTSGIRMTMTTDQPALVLYSGGFLGADTALNNRVDVASPGCAVALEAQGFPDPFHLPGAQPALLYPRKAYRHEICWAFETTASAR